MILILFVVLFLYSIPLLAIAAAALATICTADPATWIVVAGAVSQTFVLGLRDTVGALVVPLLALFAIPQVTAATPVSRATKAIVVVFGSIFLAAVAGCAWASIKSDTITGALGAASSNPFPEVVKSYGKESLTYIALVIGLSKR
ncbi:MAG TPA: hypothetical protein VMW17_03180 [Candidatus Binatia bacterium]|nr:hypothetical protein [Candidatus Binatia bacterium]